MYGILATGTLVQNRYEIVRLIGRGGMGAVYESQDARLMVTVALKQMVKSGDEQLDRAFRREAHLLARLRHPTLPVVSDYFTDTYGQFLVMQYIPGKDLEEILEQHLQTYSKPLEVNRVLRWTEQLLDVLDYLHTQNPPIIHRDIKPNNLKLTSRDEIILLDFGLAKGTSQHTQTLVTNQSLYGYTPRYAPLEQILGTGTDARSDLYALAATAYHLLTGNPPSYAPERMQELSDEQGDPLPLLHTINPQVPEPVSAVIMQALSIKAKNRPDSAAQMHALLKAAMQSSPQTLTPLPKDESVAAAGMRTLPGKVVQSSTSVTRRLDATPDLLDIPRSPADQTTEKNPSLPQDSPAVSDVTLASSPHQSQPAVQPFPTVSEALPLPPTAGDSTSHPAPDARQPARINPLFLFVVLGALVLVVGLAGVALAGANLLRSGNSQQVLGARTPDDATAIAAAVTVTPADTSTPAPTHTSRPTRTPVATPTRTPMPPPPLAIRSIEPAEAFVGVVPISFTVRGENLDQIREAQFVATTGGDIALELQQTSPEQLTLLLNALPETAIRETKYTLELNGLLQKGLQVTLRDFLEVRMVKGVKAEYDYSGRIAVDDAGPFTAMRGEPKVDSERAGKLRNSDEVEILRNDQEGWYQLRVRTSNDPEVQTGKVGWIERWIVDEEGVPAPPPTAPPPPVVEQPAPPVVEQPAPPPPPPVVEQPAPPPPPPVVEQPAPPPPPPPAPPTPGLIDLQ